MIASWVLLAVCLTVLAGFSGLILMRRRMGSRITATDWEWASEFVVDKYRPMQRLLGEEDYIFLKGQPGCDAAILHTHRKERRRVFRVYLHSLHRDFNRLYWAAKEAVMYSHANEFSLLQMILQQRAAFLWALSLVELRLVLHAAGMGTVDVRPVLGALEAMRDATRILQPAAV